MKDIFTLARQLEENAKQIQVGDFTCNKSYSQYYFKQAQETLKQLAKQLYPENED